MAQITKQIFKGNGTFVCPAGVTRVNVISENLFPVTLAHGFEAVTMVDQNTNVYSWGLNSNGQLGDGSFVPKSSPVLIAGGYQFKQVSVANAGFTPSGFALGVDAFGNAYAWGANLNGNLGTGNTTTVSSPVAVVGTTKFKWVSAYGVAANGLLAGYGLDLGGNVYAWGSNASGGLGDGTITDRSSPVLVVGGNTFRKVVVTSDAGAGAVVFGLTAANTLYTWGRGIYGLLGDGTSLSKSSPVLVAGGYSWADVIWPGGIGAEVVVGLTTSGDVYAWGLGTSMAKLTGSAAGNSSPVLVMSGKKIVKATQNTDNGIARPFIVGLTADGTAYSMGSNVVGALGDGTNIARSSPVLVVGGYKFAQIASGGLGSVYGIDFSGNLYAWGSNINGQLGDGTVVGKSSPVLVVGGNKWVAVYPDNNNNSNTVSVLAVDSNGLIWGWGANVSGDVGDNTTTAKSSPVLVVGGRNATPVMPHTQFTVDVVPGSSYAVLVGGLSSFGGVAVGPTASQITVQYWQ